MQLIDMQLIQSRFPLGVLDTIKNRTRQLEKSRHIEETFLYFNQTEK